MTLDKFVLNIYSFCSVCQSHTHTVLAHTHRQTRTHQIIICLTASSDMRKADFSTSRWVGGGGALSAPGKDKSYVGGPGVLYKNPKVTQAWLHTSRHGDTEGQRDWGGNPFTRMTTIPLVSTGSLMSRHFFSSLKPQFYTIVSLWLSVYAR